MEELQAAMKKLVELQIKQQERQQRTEKPHAMKNMKKMVWKQKLDRQQRAEKLQFEYQKQLSERQRRTEELLAQILKNNTHTDNDTAFSQDSI